MTSAISPSENSLKIWSYGWAVLWTIVVMAVQVLGQLLLMWLADRFSWQNGLSLGLQSIPALLCVFLTSLLVMRLNLSSWSESFHFLGFKKVNFKQLLVGVVSLFPVGVGYFLGYSEYCKMGTSLEPFPNWPFLLLAIFIGAGFFEEICFRGFIFQMLRRKRSFFSAATVSSALWAIGHTMEFFVSLDSEVVFVVVITVSVAFVFGFVFAVLFERGGNVIWGCVLMHFLFDSMAILDVNHKGSFFVPTGLPAVYIFGGMFLTVVSGFILSRRFLLNSPA